MARRVRPSILPIVLLVGLCWPAHGIEAATPPEAGTTLAVPKPANLPLRVPWAEGETYPFGAWFYNPDNSIQPSEDNGFYDHTCNAGGHPQDCYALDFVDMRLDTQIYPAFGGRVRFAGCATEGWWHYGRIVYIEHELDGHTYGALYAHLSSLSAEVEAAVADGRQERIGINTPIGTAGDTVTTIEPDGSPNCDSRETAMGIHLHFAVYRDGRFQESDAGIGPYGDANTRAVIPEPFVGVEVYENFQWWRGEMIAVDLAEGTADPRGRWLEDASGGSQTPTPVAHGDPVRFRLHVEDRQADIKEVHITVYYPNWHDAKSTRYADFPSRQIWRILAVCRPDSWTSNGSRCGWEGTARSADIEFDWYPDRETGPVPPVVGWLPRALPVATAAQVAPGEDVRLRMCISYDIVSTTGTVRLAPAGIHGGSCGLGAAPLPGA